MRILFPSLLLLACDPEVKKIIVDENPTEEIIDGDGDGYLSTEDCDDASALINPSAEEICDGTDNNCDGEVDEGVENIFYLDQDGDGFGLSDDFIEACDAPEFYVPNDNDCDDEDATTYPSAIEICDAVDNNCNGEIDESYSGIWYADIDGDGFGDLETETAGCQPDSSWVENGLDCDDLNGFLHPDAEEICDDIDNNCDGQIDEDLLQSYFLDLDSDGFGDPNLIVEACTQASNMVDNGLDCDDIDPMISPNADELCSDDIDNNCDGTVNEDSSIDALLWYADADQDGYGDLNQTQFSCELPVGFIDNSDDCNDYNNLQFPEATEYCNFQDDNCDGQIDEGSPIGSNTYYQDVDGDGFGDPSTAVLSCSLPSGAVTNSNDCNDADASVYLNAPELCDGLLNACAGQLPNAEADQDGDGYVECTFDFGGWDGASIQGDQDCNDLDDTVYPTAPELCDGLANTCVGILPTVEVDGDLDFYVECTLDAGGWAGTGSVFGGDDCNDLDDTVYPNAPELCDGLINTCVGILPTVEVDGDLDSYVECTLDAGGWAGTGSVFGGDDCNDLDDTVYPTAPELCDGLINSCLGALPIVEVDGDLDFYISCPLDSGGWDGTGSIVGGGDCNDLDDTVYPTAPELCDGLLNACVGTLPTVEVDGDLDSYVECTLDAGGWDGTGSVFGGDDCDDTDDFTHPYAGFQELNAFECMTDIDGDGFGTDTPSGLAVAGTDCDDGDAAHSPISGLCPQGESCYDVLARNPSASSDAYIIDPDGIGGLDPFEVYCDMTTDGGGWTEVAYVSDLQFTRHFTGGDAWYWLPIDFGYELTDAQIAAIQAVSLEGRQEYVGLCNHVIHYYYTGGGNYSYAFGFEFFGGTQIAGATSTVNSSLLSVIQDGCRQNGGENGALNLATIFAFDTPMVPIRNVLCRDCGDGGELFGSPLTNNPAWLR